MRLARLARMSVAELAGRSGQEAAKWLDRVVPADRLGAASAPCLERFFPGAGADAARIVADRMPAERALVLATAESVLARRFDLLGYRGLSFGNPIDWRLDPVSGTRSPRAHWSRIDPLDAEGVGDSKVVWELGRLQWLVTLGQAWRFTADARFASTLLADARSFISQNPVGLGIHWTSSLECALRIVSLSWALALVRDAEGVDGEVAAEVGSWLATHAAHVERYLSTWFSPNTHLTGEALGLLYAGLLLPEHPSAGRWAERGASILAEQSERQIRADGVYFEQAFCYQRYTAEIGLHALILCRRAGRAAPGALPNRLQLLLDALLALRRPDGDLPPTGDADGGWLLPLTSRAPLDTRGVFAVAAAFFGRRDYAWAASGPAPEVAWMLGAEGMAAFDALSPAPPAEAPSRALREGGYAVLSTGWQRDAHQLLFDVGPLGCPVSGAHGHADLLAVQCSAFGEPCIVDPGTYAYTAEREWRDFFRGTSAHATVMVDGQPQAEPAGPFAWRTRPRAELHRWLSTAGFDYADASHEAYGRLPDPVVHRRRVLFAKPRFWLIADELLGAAAHALELRFPFAPMPVSLGPDGWIRARGADGRGLLLRCFSTTPLVARIHRGETGPIQGWVAPDYGRREASPTLVYSTTRQLPARLLTLLVPAEDIEAPAPGTSLLEGGPAGPAGLVIDWCPGARTKVLLHERGFLLV